MAATGEKRQVWSLGSPLRAAGTAHAPRPTPTSRATDQPTLPCPSVLLEGSVRWVHHRVSTALDSVSIIIFTVIFLIHLSSHLVNLFCLWAPSTEPRARPSPGSHWTHWELGAGSAELDGEYVSPVLSEDPSIPLRLRQPCGAPASSTSRVIHVSAWTENCSHWEVLGQPLPLAQ